MIFQSPTFFSRNPIAASESIYRINRWLFVMLGACVMCVCLYMSPSATYKHTAPERSKQEKRMIGKERKREGDRETYQYHWFGRK